MDATGRWRVTVSTPVGVLPIDVDIDEQGVVSARYRDSPLDVHGVRMTPEGDGQRLTWTQRLAVPMPLNVTVDALLLGDQLLGTARAGMFFPRSRLHGQRVG